MSIRMLGHYEVLAELGKGGMGEVYRAHDPRLHRDVAIKVLPGEFAADPARRRQFEAEARTLAALSHPNTVSIFDFGVAEDVAYAVMELIEGQTLAAALAEHPFTASRAIEVATLIARGLGAAHAKGILHRDLKPANVMLTRDGQVVVLDFGLARRSNPDPGGDTTVLTTELQGTPAYLAPELINGEPPTEASDLFALGVMLHEMLSGKNPFAQATAPATMSAILRDEPAMPTTAPPALAAVIRDCLQKDPLQRIATARDLEARLAARTDTAPDTIESIAVLPFHNEADDDDTEYLIDGLTDSLIDTLSALPQLKVLARSTVFQRRELHDRPEVAGRELGVRAVLAGRLQRRGDNLVVRAELVDATDGSRLWGGRLQQPLGDLFAVEEEICREITEKLRLTLTATERERITRRYTEVPEAREAYMRGRHIWNRFKDAEAMRTAIGFFEHAIELDPLYARAYAGLGDSYAILGNVKAVAPEVAYPKARNAVLQGLGIDDQLAELHASLAFVQRYWEWDWEASRRSLDRSLELNPGYSTSYRFYAHLLNGLGEHEGAMEKVHRALELDPLSLILHTSVGDTYFYARRYEEAMDYYRRCIEMDAGFIPAHTDLARALELAGRYDEALAEFELAARLASQEAPAPSAGLACVYGWMGRHDEAHVIIDHLVQQSATRYVSPYAIGSIYACMGEADRALDWLEKALAEHDQTLVWVKVHPRLDCVRGTERYRAILEKMNLA